MVSRARARLSALPRHIKGVVYGLLSAMFVAGYVLVNKYVYLHYEVDAFSYAVTFAVAGGCIAALVLLVRKVRHNDVRVTRKTFPLLLTLGSAGGLAMALIVFGQNFTTAVNASIVMTSTIITTSFFSSLMLKERFNRRQQLWLAVLFVGLYLGIVGLHIVKFNPGDLIILAAAVVLGFNNTFSKFAIRKFDGNFVADARLAISGALMLLAGLLFVGSDVLVLSAGLWPLVGGLSFWLGIRTFYASVQRVSVNTAIVLNNTLIFFAAVGGVLLLSEPYDWVKFLGSAIVLTSVYFISKK